MQEGTPEFRRGHVCPHPILKVRPCGVQVDDKLLAVNGKTPTSPQQGAMLLRSAEGEVTIRIERPQSGDGGDGGLAVEAP